MKRKKIKISNIHIKLDEGLKRDFLDLADKKGLSLSELLRRMMVLAVNKNNLG